MSWARSVHKHSSAGFECDAKQPITMSRLCLFNCEQVRHLIKTPEQRVERGARVLEGQGFATNSANHCENLPIEMQFFAVVEQHGANCHKNEAVSGYCGFSPTTSH